MISNAVELFGKNKITKESRVIIIGSGIAGLSLAFSLEELGIPSLIIESGESIGEKEWNITAGNFSAADYGTEESYAKLHIRREVGGGSNVWGGWCSSLRDHNFEKNYIKGYPGWPIKKNELSEFYKQAGDFLQITNGNSAIINDILVDGLSDVRAKPFGFSPPVRYENSFREKVENSKLITMISNTTINSIEYSNSEIKNIQVTTTSGLRTIVAKSEIVLAGGGVGNARVLSRSKLPISKKTSSNIGKYLTEHPHCYSLGKIIFSAASERILTQKKYWSDSFISIAPSVEYLKKNSLSDFNFQISPAPKDQLSSNEKIISDNYRKLHKKDPLIFNCTLGMEQLPDISNMVIDSNTRNGISDGAIQLKFDKQVNVKNSAKKWLFDIGIHAWCEPDNNVQIQAVGHLHGTTRMSENEDEGVVDKNCAVFGVKNIYIAGSSVFPTSGFTNPTLTIAALAIRLAHHISKEKNAHTS